MLLWPKQQRQCSLHSNQLPSSALRHIMMQQRTDHIQAAWPIPTPEVRFNHSTFSCLIAASNIQQPWAMSKTLKGYFRNICVTQCTRHVKCQQACPHTISPKCPCPSAKWSCTRHWCAPLHCTDVSFTRFFFHHHAYAVSKQWFPTVAPIHSCPVIHTHT